MIEWRPFAVNARGYGAPALLIPFQDHHRSTVQAAKCFSSTDMSHNQFLFSQYDVYRIKTAFN